MENFYTTVQTSSGQIVNGATVTVYDAGSGLPATIYEPDGVTPLANPFLSGYARSEGEIEFGAANGQYNIKIVNGAETDWIYRITLLDSTGFAFGALAYENDASGVPITDAGAYYTSTDVEGALQEAGADLAAHIADPTGAHAASAISIVDTGGYYSSLDVEGALQEVPLLPPNYAYFTETRSTASPNGTIPVHQWAASGAETNIDAALTPKGTGAILSQVPDGTAAGGNKRGTYAIDWQLVRSAATQVASGNYSFSGGGLYNTVSGLYSVGNGGSANTTSGSAAVTGGGTGNLNDGDYSVIPGGQAGTVRGLYGRYSYSSGQFALQGDAQFGHQILRKQTTDATPTILVADGTTLDSTHVSVIPDNHAYAITARVIGRDTTTGDIYHVLIEGTVKRGSGAATTILDGTPAYTTISKSAGASTWAVSLVANTSRGSAEIQVTGEAATSIHWDCKFSTLEVR